AALELGARARQPHAAGRILARRVVFERVHQPVEAPGHLAELVVAAFLEARSAIAVRGGVERGVEIAERAEDLAPEVGAEEEDEREHGDRRDGEAELHRLARALDALTDRGALQLRGFEGRGGRVAEGSEGLPPVVVDEPLEGLFLEAAVEEGEGGVDLRDGDVERLLDRAAAGGLVLGERHRGPLREVVADALLERVESLAGAGRVGDDGGELAAEEHAARRVDALEEEAAEQVILELLVRGLLTRGGPEAGRDEEERRGGEGGEEGEQLSSEGHENLRMRRRSIANRRSRTRASRARTGA